MKHPILTTTIAVLIAAPLAQGAEETKHKAVPAVMAAPSIRTETTQLPETLVRGSILDYSAPDATTATKIDAPLRDIPQSVQVITRELIEDRGLLRIDQAGANVSGVQRQGFDYGDLPTPTFLTRGFETKTLYDGFLSESVITSYDIFAVERLEFLKGPSSVLYGAGGIGGTLNVVTKRPQSQRAIELGFTYGSFDTYRAALDATGPLDKKGNVLGRIIATYDNAGSFIDYHGFEKVFVAPSVTLRLGPDTTLTLAGQYQKYDDVFEYGLPFEPEALNVPISRFYGEPGYNHLGVESSSAQYQLNHRFDERFSFYSGLRWARAETDELGVMATSLLPDRRTLDRQNQTYRGWFRYESWDLQNELRAEFATGPVKHKALAGVEYIHRSDDSGYNTPGGGVVADIDLYNPQYTGQVGFLAVPSRDFNTERDAVGLYLQDLVEITPQVKALLGLRYDTVQTKTRTFGDAPTTDDRSDEAFTPRLGLVYQPRKSVSLFYGWSRYFNPISFGTTRSGSALDPEEGEQHEGGVKLSLLDDRLTATLAVFHITKNNVAIPDPADPNFSIQTGEQKSRGFEADITAQLAPGWNVIASYAYIDAFIANDTNIPSGTPLFGVPKNSGSVWTTYAFQNAPLKGWKVGFGVYAASSVSAGFPLAGETLSSSVFDLPGYYRLDAMVGYERERWKAQVNFNNITSENIYTTTSYSLKPQAPFNVMATVSFKF